MNREVGKVGASLALLVCWIGWGHMVCAAEPTVAIVPSRIELTGALASQRALLQRVDGDQVLGAVASSAVHWSVEDPRVAKWSNGKVIPLANGETRLVASWQGRSVSAEVVVRGMGQASHWLFRNHVQSVFAKMGCNSGACHGALAGKGGFKLSLRGYDTERDYWTITRQARGRRVELSAPARSLLLTKPTGAVPHKGGVRFEPDSLEYEVIASWLGQGAPGPADTDPRIERVEVFPAETVQQVGARQPLIVIAHFSDGHQEDVTRWAKYKSTNEVVANVDAAGTVDVVGHGEGAVLVWYLSKIALARITAPYEASEVASSGATPAPRNFIDRHVADKLNMLHLPASPRCDDSTFLRRAFLDTIGTLPTAQETRAFLADARPDKRDRLIESLLARPEFVDYWTYRWSDVLLVNGQRLRPKAVEAYYAWIRQQVADNRPWDQVARDILTAKGGSFENGATNFYALHQDPMAMAENASMAFLGLNINCARCHNHPLEKWTNDQYYAFANLFARVRAKGWGGDPRNGDGRLTLIVLDRGDLLQPGKGQPQLPAPLDAPPLDPRDPSDRREALADWMTAADNPYFARAAVNRIWANFFGVGIVDPPDDLRESNPASNEALLQALADYLVAHDYDLKSVMRAILRSETYQRSSRPLHHNREEQRYYARYYPRRLMAEVLLDAISQVTKVPTQFSQISLKDGSRQKTDWYPIGTRAIQLKDSAVYSPFLTTFGRNERAITCECERSSEPSLVQVLHISNGATINEKLRQPGSLVARWLEHGVTDEQAIEELYLSALSRYPTLKEREKLAALLKDDAADQRRERLEDLVWSVLSSREFLFQH